MTIIMTIIGIVTFFISFPISGFKAAVLRLLILSGIGLLIDVVFSIFAVAVFHFTL